MKPSDYTCPVCGQEVVNLERIRSAVQQRIDGGLKSSSHADDGYFVRCPVCGDFVVTTCDYDDLKSRSQRSGLPAGLCALLREHATHAGTDHPLPPIWLRYGNAPYGALEGGALAPIELDELMEKWPQTVPERLDRVLCNIARLSPTGGHVFPFPGDGASVLAFLFAATQEEARYHISALTHLGRLENITGGMAGDGHRVTPAGWDRFDQLTRGSSSPQNPVFVAMWFGVEQKKEPSELSKEEMTRIYSEAIKPAVELAGYRVSRVDLEQFNDSIMDQVFGDIRAAPFVVADFTGHRNGVYLEAGFARGLGRPVIQTCEKSHLENAHFDIKHLNHICWEDASDLQEKLFQRIRGSIGQGPHPVPKSSSPEGSVAG